MAKSNQLDLIAANDLNEIPRIAEEITQYGRRNNWSSQWISNTNLVLDELITNSISYGFGDAQDKSIRINLSVENDQLVIVMEDNGVPFNPFEEVIEPDLDADVGDRLIGGLGVYFVKILTSEHSYERVNNTNRLRLVLDSSAD